MRPLWTGSIAFGLVNIPIKIFSAVKDQSIHFHLMSSDGSCRLKQKLYCPDTGKEFDFHDTTKAYEISPGRYVLLQPKELEKLKPEKGNSIDILDFTQESEVDPIYFEKTYYLAPDRKAGKAYALLSEVMHETGMVAVGRFVMRTKEYLCLIRPYRDILVLDTLNYANEIVSTDKIPELSRHLRGIRLTAKEKEMGTKLVEKMVTRFNPRAYHDEYKETVEKLIRAKAKGKKIKATEAPAPRKNVINLMDALKRSVAKKKGRAQSQQRAS